MIEAANLAVGAIGLVALALCFWIGLRRPTIAIAVLLLALPFHTLTIVLLRHWLGTTAISLSILSLWKEALVVGLIIPAVVQMLLGRRDRTSLLAIALAAFVTVLIPLSLQGHSFSAVLVDWRGIALAPLAFVAARIRGPEIRLSRRLLGGYIAAAVVAALFSFVQVFLLGFSFLTTFYREPGEALATAYKVGLKGFEVPRAIGTFVAPNEFGLFLSIATFGFLVTYVRLWGRMSSSPIAGAPWGTLSRAGWRAAIWRREMLPAFAAVVLLAALLLSYSRSAWVASGVACLVLVAGFGAVRVFAGWIRGRPRLRLPIAVGGFLVILGLAVVSGALALFLATVTGSEASAAGRGSSFANGIDAFARHPLGLGLASAGPRAYAVDAHAIRTEAWYLVVLVEIGVVGGVLLFSSLAAITTQLLLGWRTAAGRAAIPATAVWLGALADALFIPALLDVPTALPLFVLAGLVVRSAYPLPEVASRPLAGRPWFRRAYAATGSVAARVDGAIDGAFRVPARLAGPLTGRFEPASAAVSAPRSAGPSSGGTGSGSRGRGRPGGSSGGNRGRRRGDRGR